MLRRKFASIFAIFVAVFTAVIMVACSSVEAKSAYDIACEYGFVGTEQEWLESLKGTDGTNGIDGVDGSDGVDGKDGKDGKDGEGILDIENSIDIDDLYEAYKRIYENATFEEFLAFYSIVDYNQSKEKAVARSLQSIVSIISTFSMNISKPGQTSSSDYSASGSGVIYQIEDEDVYIITNYHVIYDRSSNNTVNGIAKTIQLFTYGHEESDKAVPASFLGGSISKDIALLKADYSDFHSEIRCAEIGDSNELALGEECFAVGNPMGEGISVTFGAISVDSEDLEMEALDSQYKTVVMRVLRTDVAINGGNSGGGLFSGEGKLIGIVNAKVIETGVENIGYAIPVNVAVGISGCIKENNSTKCVLGINVEVRSTQTVYNSEKNRIDIIEEVYVTSVSGDTLGYGKLEAGDKLISVQINEGETLDISRVFYLSDYLYTARDLDVIHLKVERGGELLTIDINISASYFGEI